jgi:hypothetical protein
MTDINRIINLKYQLLNNVAIKTNLPQIKTEILKYRPYKNITSESNTYNAKLDTKRKKNKIANLLQAYAKTPYNTAIKINCTKTLYCETAALLFLKELFDKNLDDDFKSYDEIITAFIASILSAAFIVNHNVLTLYNFDEFFKLQVEKFQFTSNLDFIVYCLNKFSFNKHMCSKNTIGYGSFSYPSSIEDSHDTRKIVLKNKGVVTNFLCNRYFVLPMLKQIGKGCYVEFLECANLSSKLSPSIKLKFRDKLIEIKKNNKDEEDEVFEKFKYMQIPELEMDIDKYTY